MAKGLLRGCGLSALGVILVTGLAYAGFLYRDVLGLGPGGAVESPDERPSAEVAEETLGRFETFRTGSAQGDRLVLGGRELSSVVRYAFPGLLPAGVAEPTVGFRGDELLLSARVVVAAFPEVPELQEVLGFLPDTVEIQMRGVIQPFSPAFAALHVARVEASRIPLPQRLVPGILSALGRRDRDGLPADAMVIPLPQGVGAAFVEDERLILVAEG